MTSTKLLNILEQQYADTLRQGGQPVHWREVQARVERAFDEVQGLALEYQEQLRAWTPGRESTPDALRERADAEFQVAKRLRSLRQRILARITELEPDASPWA